MIQKIKVTSGTLLKVSFVVRFIMTAHHFCRSPLSVLDSCCVSVV
jgi:hypothetical protein